jgi:hypothetical protein
VVLAEHLALEFSKTVQQCTRHREFTLIAVPKLQYFMELRWLAPLSTQLRVIHKENAKNGFDFSENFSHTTLLAVMASAKLKAWDTCLLQGTLS